MQHPASAHQRQLKPTTTKDGSFGISERTKTKRRLETFNSAMRIHGATTENTASAAVGMVDALSKKFSKRVLVDAVSRDTKFCEKVFPQIYNRKVKEFENSNENVLRSIAVYFTKGVMGKRKYISAYKNLSTKKSLSKNRKLERMKIMFCDVSRVLPYNKLMKHVRNIEVGQILNVKEFFCSDLEEFEVGDGCFRNLTDFLPLLASFYLSLQELTGEELLWFSGSVNTFQVVLGGDGAPFGKDQTACAWLVSFLNRGKHILSSDENFLIFGANVPESGVAVRRYVKHLLHDMSEMEGKTYHINGYDVKFTFAEFPNDLKMMAFLAGELSVSAAFFSTFGNACTCNCDDPKGTFGSGSGHKWHP